VSSSVVVEHPKPQTEVPAAVVTPQTKTEHTSTTTATTLTAASSTSAAVVTYSAPANTTVPAPVAETSVVPFTGGAKMVGVDGGVIVGLLGVVAMIVVA
jgi:hypothetical protein